MGRRCIWMLQRYITKLFQYEEKIGLLIGSSSLHDLRRYIDGSQEAFYMCGYSDVRDALCSKWEDYVENYYHSTATCGWDNLITKNAVDKKDSIRMYFSLLRSYLQEYYPEIIV